MEYLSDKDANIWLGTDNGVSLARNTHPYLFIPVWQLTHSSEGNLFHSIFRDSKGNYWLGGTDGLLFVEHGLINNNPQTRWYKMNKKIIRYPITAYAIFMKTGQGIYGLLQTVA